MVAAWALGNFDPANFTDYTANPYGFDIGIKLSPLDNGTVTRLRWFRANGSAGHKPDYLRLWDVLTGDKLYETDSPDDNGIAGWQVHTLSTPIAVDKQQALIVSAVHDTYHDEALYEIVEIPAADYPVGLWVPCRWATDVAFGTIPSSATIQYLTGVDAEVTVAGGGAEYEVAAETDYIDALKWEQEADRYLLDVTTIAGWDTSKLVVDVDVRRIVGGWQPLSGSYQGKRFPIDSPHAVLELPNQARMQGLLLDTSKGSAGHIQALIKV